MQRLLMVKDSLGKQLEIENNKALHSYLKTHRHIFKSKYYKYLPD